jgi:hypothetical protein
MQAGFDLSLRMMAPRLLMHRGAGTFEELPAHDLALQSNAVIVLDHGTDFFIWTVSSHILYWMMQGSEIVGFVWFWQRDCTVSHLTVLILVSISSASICTIHSVKKQKLVPLLTKHFEVW